MAQVAVERHSRMLRLAGHLVQLFVSKCSAARASCRRSCGSTVFRFCRWTTRISKVHQFFALTFQSEPTERFWRIFYPWNAFCPTVRNRLSCTVDPTGTATVADVAISNGITPTQRHQQTACGGCQLSLQMDCQDDFASACSRHCLER